MTKDEYLYEIDDDLYKIATKNTAFALFPHF